jgi:hypothetical protein
MIGLEDQESGGRQLAPTADLEAHRLGVHRLIQDDLHLVTRTEGLSEPDVAKTLEDAPTSRPWPQRGESEGQMRNARQDRSTVEMALEATAFIGKLEPRRANGRRGGSGDRNQAGVGEGAQRRQYIEDDPPAWNAPLPADAPSCPSS